MKVCVLGGGTAGNLAALTFRKAGHDVTMVRDAETKIIGVGEATTGAFTEWLLEHDFNMYEFILNCDATPKYGTRFVGWTDPNKEYLLTFQDDKSIGLELDSPQWLDNPDNPNGLWAAMHQYGEESVKICSKYAKMGIDNTLPGLPPTDNKEYENSAWHGIAWHLDTYKTNDYFERVGISRGIKLILATVVDAVKDADNGNISSLILDNGSTVEADLFIDCTGFARVLIQKQMNAEFVDLTDTLPIDCAAPCNVEGLDSLPFGHPLYTNAVAMDNGWVWLIPTKERWGVGVLWSSKYTDRETAVKEAEAKIGVKLNPVRTIPIISGYIKTPWVGNVIALGLSAGFFEPLESTNIHFTIQEVSWLANNLDREKFNQYHEQGAMWAAQFINNHYINRDVDIKFWNDQRTNQFPVNQEINQEIMTAGTCGKHFYVPLGSIPWYYSILQRYLWMRNKLGAEPEYLGQFDYWFKQIMEDQRELDKVAIPLDQWIDEIWKTGN